ncbi:hypothetical protein F5882DRAFT_516718 [Hyaloscypha sp. PMI_1271]|nr:hypothetical protein F5882DRAFT_516718 [Hyaloscypha sp. PMI_1271]
MVSFTTLASAISMALFASAAPTVMEARGSPPPTDTVLAFTLFKSTDAGQEHQCWKNVGDGHVPPAEMNMCHKSPTFYTAKIDHQAEGYNCKLHVYNNDVCDGEPVGTILPSKDYSSPCKFPAGWLINLESWMVKCTY